MAGTIMVKKGCLDGCADDCEATSLTFLMIVALSTQLLLTLKKRRG